MAWVKQEGNPVAGCGLVFLVLGGAVLLAAVTQLNGCESFRWRDASRRGNPEAYREYLNDFPKGRHAEEAHARLKRWREAEAAWQALRRRDPKPTRQELEAFAERHAGTGAAKHARYVLEGKTTLGP